MQERASSEITSLQIHLQECFVTESADITWAREGPSPSPCTASKLHIIYFGLSLRKISSLKNKSNVYKADIFPLFTFQSKSSHIAQKPRMLMKHHAWNLVKSCLVLSSPTSLAYVGSISGNQNICSNWAQEELSLRLQLELLKRSYFRHWEDSPGRRFSGTIQVLPVTFLMVLPWLCNHLV